MTWPILNESQYDNRLYYEMNFYYNIRHLICKKGRFAFLVATKMRTDVFEKVRWPIFFSEFFFKDPLKKKFDLSTNFARQGMEKTGTGTKTQFRTCFSSTTRIGLIPKLF